MKNSTEAEIVTLSSDSEDDYSINVKIEGSSSSSHEYQSPIRKISSDPSSSLPVGLGGFINDFRMLSEDIERLKASNQNLTQMLQGTQIKLNKASYEWCTSQAQLANDETRLKAQNNLIVNLKQQANDIRFRNHELDSKLSSVSQGVKTLFQVSTKLYKENTEEVEAIETSVTSGRQIVPFQTKLQHQQDPESLFISGDFPKSMDRVGDQRLRQKLLCTSLKLENLHASFKKSMTEKEQFQREIKAELVKKNEQLQNIGQLISRGNLKIKLPKLDFQQTDSKIKEKVLVDHSQKPRFTPNCTTPTSYHARDLSIPIKNGYACICGKRFSFIATMHYHLGKHDASSKKFVCDVCSKAFLYFHTLSLHLKDSHNRFFPRNTHGCRTCGAVFPSKTEFMKGWEHRNGRCIGRKRD